MKNVSNTKGFALIVVLGTISIIAILFATAQTRILSQSMLVATEAQIAERGFTQRSMLRLARDLYGYGEGRLESDHILSIPDQNGEAHLWLQDVGGLVDLNSAHPDLLALLGSKLEIPEETLATFKTWKQAPQRLPSLRDFTRTSGASPELAYELSMVATVFSGQSGISADHAPPQVVQVFKAGAKEIQSRDLPHAWQSTPTHQVFNVLYQPAGKKIRLLGTIMVGTDVAPARILETF